MDLLESMQDSFTYHLMGTLKVRLGTTHHEDRLFVVAMSQNENRGETIWLLHHKLGHPSFKILEVFVSRLEIEILVCDVCERAKH